MATLEEVNAEIGRRTQLDAVNQEIARRGLIPSGEDTPLSPFRSPIERFTREDVVQAGLIEGEGPRRTRKTVAEEAGVRFEEGAPAGIRAKASFAVDERESIRALQTNLATFFREQGELGPNETIDIRTGPETGELEFFNPKFKQFTLVDPIGIDLGDFASLSGGAMVILPDIAMTLGISLATLNPIAGVGFGAIGAFGGEYMRLKIGQSMGINENLTEPEIIEQAQKAAGWSFVGGAAGALGVRIIKAVNNLLRGRTFSKDALPLSDKDFEEAADVAQEVNDRIGAGKLRFTTGQAADDPDLLAFEEVLKKDRSFGAVRRLRDFTERQSQALTEFWQNINQPFTSARTRGAAETGRAVERAVGGRVRAAQAGAEARVAGAEETATAARQALPVTPRQVAGAPIRSAFQAEQDAFNKWTSDRATELDTVAGATPLIVNKFTKAAAKKLKKETEETLIPAAQGPKKQLITKALDEDFSFATYWNTVSDLERRIRVAGKGLTTDTPAVGDLKFLRKAIERDAEESLKGTPMAELFDTFRTTVRKEKDRLDRSIVGDIVQTAERQFKIAPEKVFDTIFKSATEADAAIVADILKKNPQAEQLFREGIFDFYELAVIQKGKFNRTAHDKFFRDFGRRLEHFFPGGAKQLAKVGQLEKVVENLGKRREATFKALDKTFQGEIASTEPKAIFRSLWPATGPDPSRIVDLKRALKQDPGVMNAFKAEVQRDMGERITALRGQTRQLNFTNLDKYLHGTGVEGAGGRRAGLKELFGDKYVKDLDVLLGALKTAQRESIAPNFSNTSTVTNALADLARIWTGMFTAKGRAFTAARRISQRSSNRVLIEAVLDPEKMKKLQKLTTLSPGSKQAALILGQLGGLELATDRTNK